MQLLNHQISFQKVCLYALYQTSDINCASQHVTAKTQQCLRA